VHEWIDNPATKNERYDIPPSPIISRCSRKNTAKRRLETVQHLSDDVKGRFGHLLEDFEKEMAAAIRYSGSK
jgi:hypothetical protein